MPQIKILCSTYSHEAIALAVRLDGKLVKHTACDRGHVLSFSFSKAPYSDSYKEQFARAIVLYPEFIEVLSFMKLVLDVQLYSQGKISTHKPLEVDTSNSLIQSVVIVLDSARKLYFDYNGFQCESDGSLVKNPVYLLIEAIA